MYKYGDSREAGVELSAKLLDREDGVLVLRVWAQGFVYAAAETVAGQGDVAPETRENNKSLIYKHMYYRYFSFIRCI